MSFGFDGFGWPSIQKSCSSSPTNGNAPEFSDADVTPGTDFKLSSIWRSAARIASGVAVLIEGGSDIEKVSAFFGSNPGFTFHSAARDRSINPAPINSTSASAISATTYT